MDWIRKKLIGWVIGTIPFKEKLEGYKTTIGRVLALLSWLIAGVQAVFPEIQFIQVAIPYLTAFIAWIITEIGLTDKELKGKIK